MIFNKKHQKIFRTKHFQEISLIPSFLGAILTKSIVRHVQEIGQNVIFLKRFLKKFGYKLKKPTCEDILISVKKECVESRETFVFNFRILTLSSSVKDYRT